MPRRALAARWKMPAELTLDVAGLALYNIIIMAGARNSDTCVIARSAPPGLHRVRTDI